jgi:dihydrofolate reductase
MRQLALLMHTTLDGFIADTDGGIDALEPSPEEHAFANEQFAAAEAVVFGRRIYEGFAEYWDVVDLSDPSTPALELAFATTFQRMPRFVASRTLEAVDDRRATLLGANPAAALADLKRQPGSDLLLLCGPELLGALAAADVVDEYRLLVHPVVLGRGISVFSEVRRPLRLELVSTAVFESGTTLHVSRPSR